MSARLPALAVVLLLLSGVAGLLWLAEHPESPLLARAAGWPLVGPAVARFRAERLAAAAAERRPSLDASRYFAWRHGVTPKDVWLPPEVVARSGEPLRSSPADGSRPVVRVELTSSLKVLERQGDWVKVAYGDHAGWMPLDPGQQTEPPFGSAPRPTVPVPARPPDPERLALAREILGAREKSGRLGPYPLATDVVNPGRLAELDRLAGQLEEVYRQRYGREPLGTPAEAVVLFAFRSDYQSFIDRDEQLAGLPASGHSGRGIVALWDGGRPATEVGSTLLHELVHMVNRRAIGPALPSWLDEGIADDLAQSRLDAAGRLAPGTLGGTTVEIGMGFQVYGARAALAQLRMALASGSTRPLPELLDLSWPEFVRSEQRNLHYAQSAFWVRYLLDGEGGALAPGFHAFLDAVAAGGEATPEALRGHLGRSWEELEAGWAVWVLGL